MNYQIMHLINLWVSPSQFLVDNPDSLDQLDHKADRTAVHIVAVHTLVVRKAAVHTLDPYHLAAYSQGLAGHKQGDYKMDCYRVMVAG